MCIEEGGGEHIIFVKKEAGYSDRQIGRPFLSKKNVSSGIIRESVSKKKSK